MTDNDDQVDQIVDNASNVADDAIENASQSAHDAIDNAGIGSDSAKDTAHAVVDRTKDSLNEVKSNAVGLVERVQDAYADNPARVLAIGGAVLAGVVALIVIAARRN